MPQTLSPFDLSVLDMIEHSPTGSVPNTPAYQDALKRLYAAHQAYADADHKDGHVTARSLAKLRTFRAANLEAVLAGEIDVDALEANGSIFSRYVQSLPESRRAKAETYRVAVAGRPVLHRKHVGAEHAPAIHDPVHTLFLVPGTGPHPGLPGNYLYGSAFEVNAQPGSPWSVHVHDNDDGAEVFDAATVQLALAKLVEVLESAPFDLGELESLGFRTV